MTIQNIFTMAMFKENLEIVFSNLLVFLILNVLICIACYTDMRYMKIFDKFNRWMLFIRLALIPIFPLTLNMILGGALVFLVFLIAAMITCDSIGGDIKFGGNMGLWLGFTPSILFVLFTMVSNLLFRLVTGNKKTIALAPFFYIAYMMLFCLLGYL